MGDIEVGGAPPDGGVLHHTVPAATIGRPFLSKIVCAPLPLPHHQAAVLSPLADGFDGDSRRVLCL